MKQIVGIAGVALLATSLVACGSNAAESPASSSDAGGAPGSAASAQTAEATGLANEATQVPTTILQTNPLKTPAPKGQSVIFLDNGNASTAEIGAGVMQAAEAGGWTYSTITYKSNNPATLQAAFMTALQKNPAGVILAGESPSTWSQSVVDAYAEANVPIIAGSTCPVEAIGTVVAGSGTCEQNPRTGKALADWVVADAQGQPVDVLMQSMPQYNVYIGFRDAFQAELARLCAECTATVQETTLEQFGANEIPSALVNTLRTHSEYDYLVFDNGAWVRGLMPALSAAGLEDRVKILGNGINEDILSLLKADDVSVWSANAFALYGYGSFDSLLRALTDSEGIDANSALPFQLVTSATAPGVTLPYAEPATALEQYKALWMW